MDWKWLFTSFEGRINRGTFWMCVFILFVIGAASSVLDTIAGTSSFADSGPIESIVGLILIWPSLAVAAKRWHDRNKSAWWILISFIPIIGWLWALIENGFLKGTTGDNRFGPDPLAE